MANKTGKGWFTKGHKDLVPKKSRKEQAKKMLGHKYNTGYNGSKSWNWKGGISKIDKLCRLMSEYKQWRSDVFQRDKWTCKTCGANDCYVTAHHIKGFSKIIKEYNIKNISDARKCGELWDINNGVTLCEDCHKLTDNYKGRGNRHE